MDFRSSGALLISNLSIRESTVIVRDSPSDTKSEEFNKWCRVLGQLRSV